MEKTGLNLTEFSKVNWARCVEAFKCGDKPNTYFTTALAEEVGEVAGIVKKLDRGFTIRDEKKQDEKYRKYQGICNEAGVQPISAQEFWEKNKKQQLADELADIAIYLDLMATANGVNLQEAIITKFNKVSNEMNYAGTI